MIDPSTPFGKVLLVFFWGGLSANIVTALWIWFHFDPYLIAWGMVIVNMGLVTFKNYVVPAKAKK